MNLCFAFCVVHGASPPAFFKRPVSPALMGQEASAENFDNFFLVICKKAQPPFNSALQTRRYFLSKNFKTLFLLSSVFTYTALFNICVHIIFRSTANVNLETAIKKTGLPCKLRKPVLVCAFF